MKKLILDYSKWRCGGNGDNRLGDGYTSLLNEQGFMCCLGQFSKQIRSDITDDSIINRKYPSETSKLIPNLTTFPIGIFYNNTTISNKAAKINDDKETTPDQKISLLKEIFATHNYEIEVINKP